MQKDITEQQINAQIIGLNHMDKSGGNELMTEGRDIPWLQDTESADVWTEWGVLYRDVIVLNGKNEYVAVINLSLDNLENEESYSELLSLIIESQP